MPHHFIAKALNPNQNLTMHEQIIQSIRQDRDRQLVDDTLGVLVSAKYKDAALAQVAAAHMLPIEIVRAIANDLLQTATGENLEDEEFNAAINQVKWIEENIQDEGLRLWKLQALARRYRRTCTQLQEAYTKALINQKPVEPVSIREFRAQNRGRMKWLIPGWIPASTTLLIHGDGGAGKTLFTYQIFEAVVSTGIWNGYPVEVGPALLVQTDEPGLVTAERMDIRAIGDDAPLQILGDWSAGALPQLAKYIEQNRPRLVVIDSLSTINKDSICSEKDTEYARPLLHLRDIAERFDTCLVIIHHSNASGGVRGTTAIKNSVSEVWALRMDGQHRRILAVEKTRLGKPPGRYAFEFDDSDFSYRLLGEQDADNQIEEVASQEERVRLWLYEDNRFGLPWSAMEVSEFLAIPQNTSRRLLRELWATGRIHRDRFNKNRYYSYYAGELRDFVNAEQTTIDCDT